MNSSTPKRMGWLIGTMVLVIFVAGCGLLSQSRDPRVEETGGSITRGQELVKIHGCVACHSVSGVASVNDGYGPSFDDFPAQRLIGGSVENEPDTLIQFLISPQTVIPDTAMPTVGISEEDARDIATWLYSLDD